jgi:hypothetical protein
MSAFIKSLKISFPIVVSSLLSHTVFKHSASHLHLSFIFILCFFSVSSKNSVSKVIGYGLYEELLGF